MAETVFYRTRGEEILLSVKAIPNAGRSACAGLRSAELVVRLKAQPEKGKANRELIEHLARVLGVARSEVWIESGQSSSHKKVRLPAACRPALEALSAPRDRDP